MSGGMVTDTKSASLASRNPQSHWAWSVLFGTVLIVLGAFAWFAVVSVGFASMGWIGAALCAGGVAQGLHALRDRPWGMFVPHIVAGGLYTVAGLLAMAEPEAGGAVLTALIAGLIAAGGLLRIAVAVRHWHLGGAGLLLIGGLVGILIGVALDQSLPWPGIWVPGSLIAVELIVHGAAWFELGLALRRLGPPA